MFTETVHLCREVIQPAKTWHPLSQTRRMSRPEGAAASFPPEITGESLNEVRSREQIVPGLSTPRGEIDT